MSWGDSEHDLLRKAFVRDLARRLEVRTSSHTRTTIDRLHRAVEVLIEDRYHLRHECDELRRRLKIAHGVLDCSDIAGFEQRMDQVDSGIYYSRERPDFVDDTEPRYEAEEQSADGSTASPKSRIDDTDPVLDDDKPAVKTGGAMTGVNLKVKTFEEFLADRETPEENREVTVADQQPGDDSGDGDAGRDELEF